MEFSFSFSLSLITFFEVYDEWFCCEMKSHSLTLTLTLTHPSPVSFSSRYILSLSLCHGRSSLPLEFIHFYLSLLFHPLYIQYLLHPSLSLSLSLFLSFSTTEQTCLLEGSSKAIFLYLSLCTSFYYSGLMNHTSASPYSFYQSMLVYFSFFVFP